MTNIVNETVQNSMSVLHPGTIETEYFVISGAIYHSVLRVPIYQYFQDLNGVKLKFLLDSLDAIILVIIDEISMMSKKILHQIYKQLLQASGNVSDAFGGFTVVLVGDFQQLPPVEETEIYQPDYSPGSL